MLTHPANPSIANQPTQTQVEENSRRRLTDREIEVLSLISAGNASKNVAQMLEISKRTVDFHLANIYTKLDANNRVQAINNAKAKGYL
jgi:DNA-binding NarL/FixJ family response regulator